MLLDARLEALIEVVAEGAHALGRPYYECRLASEDGQILHLFEGQLKEMPGLRLEVGRTYKARFRPFLNNKWVEVKLASIEPA